MMRMIRYPNVIRFPDSADLDHRAVLAQYLHNDKRGRMAGHIVSATIIRRTDSVGKSAGTLIGSDRR